MLYHQLSEYYPPSAYSSPFELLPKLHENSSSGLYYIRAKSVDIIRHISENFFSEFTKRLQCPRCPCSLDPLVIYIGKANGRDGLYQRLMQELYHVGAGTFFRGLGAVMGKNPQRATTPASVKNYRFMDPEKKQIIEFIEDNLEIVVVSLPSDEIISAELREICRYGPIFNSDHNPCPSHLLKENRERCRRYAGEFILQ